MKILHTVEYYAPSKGGAQEVVRQLSERLVVLGHDVTVATSPLENRNFNTLNGVKIRTFDIKGTYRKGYLGKIGQYQDFLLNSGFDIIMNYAAQQWTTDLCLPILTKIKAKKIFVPCGFAGLYVPRFADYFAQMPKWMNQYNANIFLSDIYRDIKFSREKGVHNIHIIPNGCGFNEFGVAPKVDIRQKLNIPSNHFLVLHVGSHTGIKGHRDLFKILRQSKIENATLLLIGNPAEYGCARSCKAREWIFNHSPFLKSRNCNVVVKDLNRDEIIASYHEADLFLFPSNIECSPLVLFESMASKTPFLATDAGNSSEIAQWSGGGLILPTKQRKNGRCYAEIPESGKMLQDLWLNQNKRESLGMAGHDVWLEKFTWEKITLQYEALYKKLLTTAKDI